ncbi:MAG: hypothetical protein ACRENS_12895 [Candidatus Eiseniibacteriota bacterium]
MRNLAKLMLVAVIVLLIGATVAEYQNYRQANAKYIEMKTAEETARSQYAEAFNSIGEIQDSLNAIRIGDGLVKLHPQDFESQHRLTEPTRREVMESIAQLNASIQRTKDNIRDLELSLKKSGLRAAGLEKMIAGLKSTLADREAQVEQLTAQVNELQTQVAGLQETVQQSQETITAKDQVIEQDRREMGTVYYLIGTRQELANRGVIVAKGGVLGLGKTVQLSGKFDDTMFTPLDTDRNSVIRSEAGKVVVLSPQPVSSYELKLEGNQVEVHILNAAEFRKVKHVVIMKA